MRTLIALTVCAALYTGSAFAQVQTQSRWIEVRPERGFAYAVKVSDINTSADVRTSIVAYTHDNAPNPGDQYFSVMRGEVDCRARVSRMSEILIYDLSDLGTAATLPLEPEPKPVRVGSVDALVCDWPNWSNRDQVVYEYASEFADAVRARPQTDE